MTVLSLFDGMSCGQIALKELGIKVDKYYASEIDKFAIAQTQLNFPDTIQLGSVVDVDVSKLDRIDLLLGGSPCQSFSFAGKRKGMSTKCNEEIYTLERYLKLKEDGFEFEGQSYLFWEYMRILNDIRKYNPDVKFLLENVEMGNKWERVLSEAIGVFGVHINSALVSAQNRKRIYWTNIRTKEVGLFGEVHSDIPQPADEGIVLRDILESEVDEKYYLSDAVLKRMSNPHKSFTPKIDPDKTGCLSTGNNSSKMAFDSGATFISIDGKSKTVRTGGRSSATKKHNWDIIKIDKQGNPKANQDKASCFTAGGNSGGNHSDMDLIVHNMMPRSSKSGKGGTGHLTRSDGKTYYLDTGQTNAIQLNTSTESGGKQPYKQNRVYADYGKAPAILANMSCGSHAVKEERIGGYSINERGIRPHRGDAKKTGISELGTILYDNQKTDTHTTSHVQKFISQSNIRRLTPTECARLQTVPDWYKWECSETQQYRMLGNGWTIKVIMHILKYLDYDRTLN